MCLVPRWNGALCTPCSVTTMSSFSTTERLSRWTSYKDQNRNSPKKYVLSKSPSRYYNHPQPMLTTITKCSAVTKINTTTHRKNIVTSTPRPPPPHHHPQTILTTITIAPTIDSDDIITTITIYAHRWSQHHGWKVSTVESVATLTATQRTRCKTRWTFFYFLFFHLDKAPNSDSIEIFDRPTFDLLPDRSHGACRHALKGLVPTVVPSRKWLFWCKK